MFFSFVTERDMKGEPIKEIRVNIFKVSYYAPVARTLPYMTEIFFKRATNPASDEQNDSIVVMHRAKDIDEALVHHGIAIPSIESTINFLRNSSDDKTQTPDL